MPLHGRATRHRRPISLRRDVYVRPRRSSPVVARALAGNNLVFGPGGEAAIVPLQPIGAIPAAGPSQNADQTVWQVGLATQAGLPFSTGAVAVMKPDTEQPSASVVDLTLSIGPMSETSAADSAVATAPVSAITTSAYASETAASSSSAGALSSTGTRSFPLSSATSMSTAAAISSPNQPTLSSSSALASTRMSSNPSGALYADRTGIKVGVSFGTLAVIGLLVALVSWWLRVRQRMRTRELEESVIWPWNKGTPRMVLPRSPATLETGFRPTPLNGETAGAWSADCLDRPDGISPTDGRLPTFPPASHSLDATPYQAVQFHHPNNSVPDLAPNMGALQVANLVPGDITSGSESSRASSVMSMAFMGSQAIPECGTPYEPMAGERPRFLGLQGNGLPVPWSPLHVRKTAEAVRMKSSSNVSEKSLDPLPYPGDAPIVPAPGGWAASIKTNIVNALSAVVRGSNSSHPSGDNLTSPPCRRKREWHCEGDEPHREIRAMSRETSVHSVHSGIKRWPPGEVASGDTSVTHLDAVATELPAAMSWSSISLEDDPPSAVGRDGSLGDTTICDKERMLDVIEAYYSVQAQEESSPHLNSDPPRLPDIPQISHTPSLSSLAIVCQGRSQRKSTMFKKAGTRKKTRTSRRPTLLARASSSACSHWRDGCCESDGGG
ncbi:hypothetical protein DAEQUDRAFT_321744 [Daedalea quercina L-15889]|uniref:Uncharacterized protein n=1 Tax=Daedalea quercina L-15889 TaxID=1314783 RepID=A0A165PS93_9APHY|nr:hypothetical protein DAEQUDRAFT_321744 [Daedalea quercina L-15889]